MKKRPDGKTKFLYSSTHQNIYRKGDSDYEDSRCIYQSING